MSFTGRFRTAILIFALLTLAATAVAETNTVQIFVYPKSGTVCLDTLCQVGQGALSGYSSTKFEGVTGGQDHTIRVIDTDGYQDYSEQVSMDPSGHPMTFRIYLEQIPVQTAPPGTGTIQVLVSPGLGQVCLDAKECESSVGEVSTTWSMQFSDVPTDTAHTITVTADGYQSSTQQITIQPGQVNEVEITLQPAAPVTGTTQAPVASPPVTRSGPDGYVAILAAGIGCVLFTGCRT